MPRIRRGQSILPNASTCATVRSGVDILSGGFAIVDHRHGIPSKAEKTAVDETLIVSALVVVVDASDGHHPPLHKRLGYHSSSRIGIISPVTALLGAVEVELSRGRCSFVVK